MIPVGARVKDSISDVEGIVVCRAEWIYGCIRLTIQPFGAKDGRPLECFTVDEPQCVILSTVSAVTIPDGPVVESKHGPRPECPTRPDPVR